MWLFWTVGGNRTTRGSPQTQGEHRKPLSGWESSQRASVHWATVTPGDASPLSAWMLWSRVAQFCPACIGSVEPGVSEQETSETCGTDCGPPNTGLKPPKTSHSGQLETLNCWSESVRVNDLSVCPGMDQRHVQFIFPVFTINMSETDWHTPDSWMAKIKLFVHSKTNLYRLKTWINYLSILKTTLDLDLIMYEVSKAASKSHLTVLQCLHNNICLL